MWEKALALARAISANVSNETVNDGVRMQSAKFCESACLLLAGVGWGASVVKPTHKLLKLDELGKLSDEKRDALEDGLKVAIEKEKFYNLIILRCYMACERDLFARLFSLSLSLSLSFTNNLTWMFSSQFFRPTLLPAWSLPSPEHFRRIIANRMQGVRTT